MTANISPCLYHVGVDSKIKDDYSSKICVGGDNFIAQYDDSFDTWSNLEEWLWSTTSDLIISDSTLSQTNLSIVTPILPDSSVIYDLKLRLTNDVGCWEEDSVTIEGYQVHADFFTLDTVVYCAPNEILISSLHNNYIESYSWFFYLNDSCDFDVNGYNNNFSDSSCLNQTDLISEKAGAHPVITQNGYYDTYFL